MSGPPRRQGDGRRAVTDGPGGSAVERVPAPLMVLVAIASVQIGSAVARGLFDELGAAGVTLLRLGLAAAVVLALTRPALRGWRRQQWQAAALLGAAMAGMNLTFYLALRTVPLGVAVTVEFVGPLLLALAQTRRAADLGWAALAGAGVVLLGADSLGAAATTPLSGLLLALVAGLFWAGYIVASAGVGRVVPGVDGLGVALAIAALLVLPFGAAGAAGVLERPSLLLLAGLVALLSSVISYALELTALRRLPTRVFGVLMSLEPAAAASAGLVLLRQALGGREAVALLLVSLASAGVTLGRRGRRGSPPVQPLD